MANATAATDAELLDRFVRHQDLAAFEGLLRRHGPMVYRVCQRILQHASDAEDAFQATFVVLVKKAATIGRPELVGGWLHGVAQRIAMKARTQAARRQQREQPLHEPVAPPNREAGWREVSPILDEELNQLPDQYRTPLVLCYLEGKTNDQAADQLGWTRGKVAGNSARGRDLLRKRLARRGLSLTSAALGGLLLQQTSQAAAMPAALAGVALQTAATGASAAPAAALAEGISMSAGMSAKWVAVALVATTVAAGGIAYVIRARPVAEVIAFQSFDGPTVPVNRAGEAYPNPYQPDNGGQFTASIQSADAVAGSCLQMHLLDGWLKAQFDPNEVKGRGFTRQFIQQPDDWRFNTFNRFRFWIKLPAEARGHAINGRANMGLGTYVKRVRDADPFGLDTGGGGFFHLFNVPATGHWTQVVLNMHPSWRRQPTDQDIGNQPHPTGEAEFNYFDAMTRFFLEARGQPSRYPVDYFLDEMEFYREADAENDEQVYSITATHVPQQQRIILTWNRRVGEDDVHHEVRYAFGNIHQLGWDQATPAPGGRLKPPGTREHSGMVWDGSLPLQGQQLIYLAIKPENATLFSQVALRLVKD